jgi:hypothetical protein
MKGKIMYSRERQAGYLASVAQSFDVGDFDYLPPQEMRTLNALIATAWKTFGQQVNIEDQITAIEQAIKPQNGLARSE